jgi:hypothetical protein
MEILQKRVMNLIEDKLKQTPVHICGSVALGAAPPSGDLCSIRSLRRNQTSRTMPLPDGSLPGANRQATGQARRQTKASRRTPECVLVSTVQVTGGFGTLTQLIKAPK